MASALFIIAFSGSTATTRTELSASAIVYLVVLTALGVFGHIVNDFSDRELDAQSGKIKPSQILPPRIFILAMVLLPVLSVILVAAVERNTFLSAMWAGLYLIAAAYSLPPLRLKARGISGWWASALSQRALPVALAVISFGEWTVSGGFLTGYFLLVGIRFIMIHQLDDYETDSIAGIKTGVVQVGPKKTVSLVSRLVWPLELASLFGLVFTAGQAYLAAGYIVAFCIVFAIIDSVAHGYFSPRHQPLGVKNNLLASFGSVYFPVFVSVYSVFLHEASMFIALFILLFTAPAFLRRLKSIVNRMLSS